MKLRYSVGWMIDSLGCHDFYVVPPGKRRNESNRISGRTFRTLAEAEAYIAGREDQTREVKQ